MYREILEPVSPNTHFFQSVKSSKFKRSRKGSRKGSRKRTKKRIKNKRTVSK